MSEVKWVDVVGYESFYEVSSLGVVRRKKSYITVNKNNKQFTKCLNERTLKAPISGEYPRVDLCKNNTKKSTAIHTIMAHAFNLGLTEGKQINHKDGNKWNNNLENLEAVTPKRNINHAIEMGLRNNRGENNAHSKLTDDQVRIIKTHLLGTVKVNDIASRYGVSKGVIYSIKYGKTWKHVHKEELKDEKADS